MCEKEKFWRRNIHIAAVSSDLVKGNDMRTTKNNADVTLSPRSFILKSTVDSTMLWYICLDGTDTDLAQFSFFTIASSLNSNNLL